MKEMVEILKQGDGRVPRLLLENYKKLDIKEFDLVLLIFLINIGYNPMLIASMMDSKLPVILESIDNLKEKGLVKIELQTVNNIKEEVLILDPLYEKLFFLMNGDNKENKSTIYTTFENELGRTLSNIEYEIISGWLKDNTEELLILALKEATYNGVSNFRYIDRIIHEWNKKGIKTKEDVERNNREFNKPKTVIEQELFDYDWLNDNN